MSPQNNASGTPSASSSGAIGYHHQPMRGPTLPADGVSANANEDEIPVIDLANPDISLLVEQMHRACSTWGFFQLINHGISPELISSFRNGMGDFFALPFETKAKLKRDAHNARGYFDDELTKRRRDWKEALDVGVPGGRDWDRDDAGEGNACLDGYNRFPSEDECPKFRDVVVEYFEECAELSNRLAGLMVLALSGGENVEDQFLRRMRGYHTSYLRMNYYPPSDNVGDDGLDSARNLHNNSFSTKAAGEGTLGISPHRDAGFLTILLQDDDCHSLQVARFEDDDHVGDDDRWVTVHPIPGAVTINTGDMAMICSNGRFCAPLHRVLTDPAKRRYSAPFFYNPGYEEMISPFAFCRGRQSEDASDREVIANGGASGNDAPRYRPCLWGYFRALRFAGDLTDLGVEIQTSHFRVGSDSDHVEKQGRFAEAVDFKEPFDVERYRHILESKD